MISKFILLDKLYLHKMMSALQTYDSQAFLKPHSIKFCLWFTNDSLPTVVIFWAICKYFFFNRLNWNFKFTAGLRYVHIPELEDYVDVVADLLELYTCMDLCTTTCLYLRTTSMLLQISWWWNTRTNMLSWGFATDGESATKSRIITRAWISVAKRCLLLILVEEGRIVNMRSPETSSSSRVSLVAYSFAIYLQVKYSSEYS